MLFSKVHLTTNYSFIFNRILILLLCCSCLFKLNGQQLDWAAGIYNQNAIETSIVHDAAGNLFIAGVFKDSVNVELDSTKTHFLTADKNSSGNSLNQIFIAKYSPDRTLFWAMKIGGTNLTSFSIVKNGSDGIIVAGKFLHKIKIYVNDSTSIDSIDVGNNIYTFVLNISGGKQLKWFRHFKANSVGAISVNSSRHIYINGGFSGNVDFNPGTGTQFLNSTNGSSYMLKLDSAGQFKTVKQMHYHSQHIEIDPKQNLILSGGFLVSRNFATGNATPYTLNPMNLGYEDLYISKLDSNMNLVWAKQIGGCKCLIDMTDIALDSGGSFYGTGIFSMGQPTDFDPGSGVFHLTSNVVREMFIVKLDSSGNFAWAGQSKGDWFTNSSNIALDKSNGDIWVAGDYGGYVDFDMGTDTVLKGASGRDPFLVHYSNTGSFKSFKDFYGLGSTENTHLSVINNAIYMTGSFLSGITFGTNPNYTFLSGNGAYISKFLNCNDTLIQNNILSCQPYTLPNGQVLTSSGTYTDSLKSQNGCDSLIFYDIEIYTATTSQINVSTCDSYLSPSGNLYTSTGLYSDTIPNYKGCDSIISINLTITPLQAGILINGNKLVCYNNNMTYQWVNCDSNYAAITGAISQTFTPEMNGSYAIIISNGTCSDTSECVDVTNIVSVEESSLEEIAIYPNPASSVLNIRSHLNGIYDVSIMDNSGRIIQKINDFQLMDQAKISISHLPTGRYILKLQGDQQQFVLTFRKRSL